MYSSKRRYSYEPPISNRYTAEFHQKWGSLTRILSAVAISKQQDIPRWNSTEILMDSSMVIVHRSDTRRKACTGCVKAKRRCDLTLPTCARCTTRKLTCSYAETDLASKPVKCAPISCEQALVVPTRTSAVSTPLPDPIVIDSAMDNFFASPYDSFLFPELGVLNPHQVEYCLFELRRCVDTLVLEGRNAFIHPSLYQEPMPEMYQDLLGMCSLYMQRTSRNHSIVFRMIGARRKKLLEAAKSVVKPRELLLVVQALVIYQTMRLFDGDAEQRLIAEQDMKLLESWTDRLQREYSEAETSSMGHARHWVLMESIRRTIMVSFLVRGLYASVTSGICDVVHILFTLLVSENAEGWDNEEGEGFLPDRNQSLVTYPGYVEDWNFGRVTTFNVYEMILLKACPHTHFSGALQWCDQAVTAIDDLETSLDGII